MALGAARGGKRKTTEGSSKKIGYAVVGLGHIVQAAVLPAFKHAAELAVGGARLRRRKQLVNAESPFQD